MGFKGYIQVYTGDGKGKTTAAVGLTIRALGAGLKVAFLQFFKDGTTSEVKILKTLPNLYYQHYGQKGFVSDITPELKEIIQKGWEEAKRLVFSKEYNIIVLDEFTLALNWGLVEKEEVLQVLKNKPEEVEIVITGRKAPEDLLSLAHLVTEMKKIKHYYDQGVLDRLGIER
ncbi:cob(I)yrinic acid a,c-diamide adenosyltransferase [Thermodesulfobacterium sp. TA1]|uniref:cob(I)yrinic acid a,c-diamide adenosyltransferase n=1 Tax=Thermodesulfobacterium sp. TA1 TaxID=2234087 RepID=UPI0012321B7C|nr:cob(I)yrinic acid a,c-diamide adenosyltransferase [Thermodesulfobacterium sp. TA1]QER42775.1 cob(I)yrinic acid a,c-diamide adenosyltransferase [Thermodesulfobacterium sp. TA1]